MIDRTLGAEFVGGVGLTHLRVYDERPAPDGRMCGCAHIHGITDEGYYVIDGSGTLELHDANKGFRAIPLVQGGYVQFTPGTLHRTVSEGSLEVLVIMGNAGLAERGDARIYFGRAVDEDRGEYARLAGLPEKRGLEGALERRDASIAAYSELLRLWERDRRAYGKELERFLDVHRGELAGSSESLREAVVSGPGHWSRVALHRIEALATDGEPARAGATDQQRGGPKFGMCGILHQIHGLDSV